MKGIHGDLMIKFLLHYRNTIFARNNISILLLRKIKRKKKKKKIYYKIIRLYLHRHFIFTVLRTNET